MKKSTPALVPYRISLAGTLLAAREAVMAPIRPMLRDANVTEQQWRVLRVLAEHEHLAASAIAEQALLHAPSVTRILKELAERGLIRRTIDIEDGRRAIAQIAPEGRQLMADTARQTTKVIAALGNAFGAERLAAMQSELRAFTEAANRATSPDAD